MGNCLQNQRQQERTVTNTQVEFVDIGTTATDQIAHPQSVEQSIIPTAPSCDVIQDIDTTRLLVAAIDFGTTFSGYAFSFRHEYVTNPSKISVNLWQHSSGLSHKAPTAVLIGPDQKVKSFGYEAESEYADIVLGNNSTNWYFFHQFKMTLYKKQAVTADTPLQDVNGKRLPAMLVFSGVIAYLKNHLKAKLEGMDNKSYIPDSSIHWVLTVPAIWNDKSKQFMRKAAQKAGIRSEQLTLSLEAEAASLYCRHLPPFNYTGLHSCVEYQQNTFDNGTKYIILDLGGGTVDVTVHEIQSDGTLQECHQATGGYWGGTTVDLNFYTMLSTIFRQSLFVFLRTNHPQELLELYSEFEIKKRTFELSQTKPVSIRMPVAFIEAAETIYGKQFADMIKESQYHEYLEIRKDKMSIKAELFKEFFTKSVSSIVNHIQDLIQQPHLNDVSTILLIGGYSECDVVKTTVISSFPHLRVVRPDDAGLAVLKGAVLFGHEPHSISSRVCKYTYGIAMTLPFEEGVHPEDKRRFIAGCVVCDDIFSVHLCVGERVRLGEDQPEKEYSLMPGQTKGVLEIFASNRPNPVFVTDEGCTFLGSVVIENPDGFQNSGKIFVKILYSGTELEVEAREENTGKLKKAYFDFLG